MENVPYPKLRTKGQFRREITWSVHNVIAHPLSEFAFWLDFLLPGARAVGDKLHDITVPDHEPGTGRG